MNRKQCGEEIERIVKQISNDFGNYENHKIPLPRFELLLHCNLRGLQKIAEDLGVFYIDID